MLCLDHFVAATENFQHSWFSGFCPDGSEHVAEPLLDCNVPIFADTEISLNIISTTVGANCWAGKRLENTTADADVGNKTNNAPTDVLCEYLVIDLEQSHQDK